MRKSSKWANNELKYDITWDIYFVLVIFGPRIKDEINKLCQRIQYKSF